MESWRARENNDNMDNVLWASSGHLFMCIFKSVAGGYILHYHNTENLFLYQECGDDLEKFVREFYRIMQVV